MATPRFNYDASNIQIECFVPEFEKKFVRSSFDKEMNANPNINRAKLLELENDNRFVIRKSDSVVATQRSIIECEVEKVRKLFEELKEAYSVIAPVHFRVAEDVEGKVAYYSFTQRVHAVEYDEMNAAKQRIVAQEMCNLCKNVVRYFLDKINSEETYLDDLSDIGQYVYGTIEGDLTARWYLIDTDPYYKTRREEDSWMDVYEIFLSFLEKVETKYSIDLSTECEYFKNLLNEEYQRVV